MIYSVNAPKKCNDGIDFSLYTHPALPALVMIQAPTVCGTAFLHSECILISHWEKALSALTRLA
ncbi:hypothetical protein J3R73_000019 [Labrys monachus]|uniref:Uncharacterized protein n=1 Tax=Labrys monachus TaxID=217067 RepID=A0ABU0F789_9HYPH|nr:hypothetical protein [Labrys monachus]